MLYANLSFFAEIEADTGYLRNFAFVFNSAIYPIMNKETRIQKIKEVETPANQIAVMELVWQDNLEKMPVYNVPLQYLVYNKYNGRILSRTKSLETQHNEINPETAAGKALLEKLLYESNEQRNEQTLKDINKFGQKKYGIITKDGIIIDGNRRAMLLNRLHKDYFKAVILPVTLEENPIEIEKLETSYQMAEDEKLGYNAIEKYIKAKEIYLKLTNESDFDVDELDATAVAKIAAWMGETDGTIKKYLQIIKVMDEYLDYCEYSGIYTQLDNREDQFISLSKWLKTYYGEDSAKGFDGYTDLDVDDLKRIAFDYIRIKDHYDGKQFRLLAEGGRENHIFGNKQIWKAFRDKHLAIVDAMPELPEIDYESDDLKRHLDSLDEVFFKNANRPNGENAFIANLLNSKERINYFKDAAEPEKLVTKAYQALENFDPNNPAVKNPDIQDMMEEVAVKAFTCIGKVDPERVLNQVIEMLSDIDLSELSDTDVEGVQYKFNLINGIIHRLKSLI